MNVAISSSLIIFTSGISEKLQECKIPISHRASKRLLGIYDRLLLVLTILKSITSFSRWQLLALSSERSFLKRTVLRTSSLIFLKRDPQDTPKLWTPWTSSKITHGEEKGRKGRIDK